MTYTTAALHTIDTAFEVAEVIKEVTEKTYAALTSAQARRIYKVSAEVATLVAVETVKFVWSLIILMTDLAVNWIHATVEECESKGVLIACEQSDRPIVLRSFTSGLATMPTEAPSSPTEARCLPAVVERTPLALPPAKKPLPPVTVPSYRALLAEAKRKKLHGYTQMNKERLAVALGYAV